MTGGGFESGIGERLDSWKAIAAYLGRDAGTVRRWERTRGLPVHRVPGGKGSSVFAYTSEIDAWLQSAPKESPAAAEEAGAEEDGARRSGTWRWAAASAGIVALLVVGWLIQLPSAGADRLQVHMTEQSVTAADGDGRELWVHRLDEKFRHIKTESSEPIRVVSGRNPRVYFLTSQRIGRADNTADGGEFTSLDANGNERFTFRMFDNLRFAGKYYGAPWALTAFSVLDGDATRLAVAAHHWVWSPSIVAILDDKGNRLGTYAGHGWIEQLHWISRDRLVFGGFLESKNGGMVGLLDPSALDGQSPEEPGSPHECENCGKRPPLRMAAMPRTEVNLATESRFNRAIVERTGDRLIVRTIEVPQLDGQGAADAIYEFTTGLDFVTASYSQRYWEIHDRLAREKKIDHDRTQCPSKDGPREIHVWTPEHGWSVKPIR